MRRVSANALKEHAASANSPSDIIHVHERRSAVLGIARCATGPACFVRRFPANGTDAWL